MLTREQIERQDFVDNAILELLRLLIRRETYAWDIEEIGLIRDDIEELATAHGWAPGAFYPVDDEAADDD